MPSATRVLIEKDLRELRPWAVLFVFLGLVELLDRLTDQMDMRPASHTANLIGGGMLKFAWVLAFAMSTSLGTREQDDGTLAFLDGLPLERARTYLVRCLVTAGVVALFPTLNLLTILGLHALSSGSLDHAYRLDLLLQCYALHVAAVAHGVLVGAAFGFLRSLTWLAAGTLASALALVLEHVPRLGLLNPLQLGDAELLDSGLALDMETVLAQLSIAALALLAGVWRFESAGRPSRTDLSQRPALRAVVYVATCGTLVAALALWQSGDADGSARGARRASARGPQFPDSPPAQTRTEHYRFSYPAVRSEAALALAEHADAIFVRVHALLGQPPGAPIDVDASGSARNTAGTAYFGRVRLELGANTEDVLAHETAHVVAQRLAGAERDWLWRKAMVLDEGLAAWVEHRYALDERGRARTPRDAAKSLVLAALQTRGELRWEEVADPELFARHRDENLKYAVGEAIMATIARLYGEAALPRLVRAFGNEKLPVGLAGLELWQVAFQGAGLDLGAVLDALARDVDREAQAHADELAALERPRVRLVRRGNAIGVEPLLDGDGSRAAHSVLLRFKPGPDSPSKEYDLDSARPGHPIRRPRSRIQNAQVCVQAGVPLGDDVLYEPWSCLPTRDATEWSGDLE